MSNWPYPRIVAHRGGGKLAPENTLAAIDVGAKYGHKMIEFDAKLSKDGEIFLLHDDNLERTSNGWGVAGELNWQDLLRVDAGSWYSKAFKGESLPLLSQVAERCREHGMMANIEIKPTTGTGPLTGKMVALAARQLWAGMTPPLLSSFEIDALEAAQLAAPELPRGLLLDEWRDDWRELTARLIEAGARMAHPGEFTQRAFLNGKMDLSQAEAVADLIAADSRAAHRVAIQQLRGGFSRELAGLREKLLHFVSLMELELDFSDHEDLVFADRSELLTLAQGIDRKLGELAATFRTGNAIKNGIPVAIVGETNAGKSTLLNALLGEEKAIVSDIHGTTRDVIEDTVIIDGLTFRFIDTAGLRKTADQIESIGISRAYAKMDQADMVLWMIDSMDISKADTLKTEIRRRTADKVLILLFNKSESLTGPQREAVTAAFSDFACPQLFISARSGQGLDALRALLVRESRIPDATANPVIITNVRHYDCLLRAREAIQRVVPALQSGVSGDLVSQDIRECLYHLSDIAGEVTTDDVLSTIFRNFCIGK